MVCWVREHDQIMLGESDDSPIAIQILEGDALSKLANIEGESVDSIVTDPPYGLADIPGTLIEEVMREWVSGNDAYLPEGSGFLGNEWDRFVPPPKLWKECLRVLKPGGHILAFAGSRTHDLMSMSIRLAGFEIRDNITWHYGTGMPKGMNIGVKLEKRDGDSQGWDGWNTTLKPASEPIVMARKPFEGTLLDNVMKHEVGGINVEGCSIQTTVPRPHRVVTGHRERTSGQVLENSGAKAGSQAVGNTMKGRYPPNAVLQHGDECGEDICITGCPVAEMDNQAPSTGGAAPASGPTHTGVNKSNSLAGYRKGMGERAPQFYGDEGGASRFFYTSKASKKERPTYKQDDGTTIAHPTVKSLNLMKWLVRLVTPSGGTVLDPFAGSGTTLEAAALEKTNAIGIELTPKYIPLIEQRLQRNGFTSQTS